MSVLSNLGNKLPLGALSNRGNAASGEEPGRKAGDGTTNLSQGNSDQQQSQESDSAAAPVPIAIPQNRKPQQFSFRYDDTDTLITELQEFYPYVEVLSLADGMKEFQSSKDSPHDGKWTETPSSERKTHMVSLINLLESSDRDIRFSAAKRLSYLVQGNFAETNSEEEQLHWCAENCHMLRRLDGVSAVMLGLMDANRRHDALATNHIQRTAEEAEEIAGRIDDTSTEVGLFLGILYFVVEVCRGDEEFGEELMALQVPLPTYLLNSVAGLREKADRGFPVKKLLLLLWKTLLACLGGLNEARRAVDLQRELNGLAPVKRSFTRVTPTGVQHFRKDLSIKYPTYTSPMTTDPFNTEKLAEAVEAVPLRSAYHSSVEEGLPPAFVSRPPLKPPTNAPGAANAGEGQAGQTDTPIPTPPVTPPMKPKKQQYQTDQTRPFVFPFTRSETTRLVPQAIDEADKLFQKYTHVPLGMYQLKKTRDEYIREESGLGFGLGGVDSGGLMGIGKSKDVYEDEEDFGGLGRGASDDEAWTTWKVEDWKLEEEELEARQAENKSRLKSIRQKRSSLRKLYHVEVIYRTTLPVGQSIVVVLLKLLLATVTGMPAPPQQGPGSPLDDKNAFMVDQPPDLKAMSLEETDVARHREITSKAVSAILLLLLKWFKASHVLKFQHLSILLIDSNCLLLVLKMFGLQELLSLVQAKHEKPEYNLFRYCFLNFSPSKDDASIRQQLVENDNSRPAKTIITVNGEETELINEYSWRNFFYTINFMRIMHLLTKNRAMRINLLVQYKSTVSGI